MNVVINYVLTTIKDYGFIKMYLIQSSIYLGRWF